MHSKRRLADPLSLIVPLSLLRRYQPLADVFPVDHLPDLYVCAWLGGWWRQWQCLW